MQSSSLDASEQRWRRNRRMAFLVIAGTVLIDAAPGSWTWLQKAKFIVSPVVQRVGLWQGEWAMFAPNPVVTNGWMSIEVRTSDGERIVRDTTYWARESVWQKFLRFRHVNFVNRIDNSWNIPAAEDYADYMAKQIAGGKKVVECKLYKNTVEPILVPGEPIPDRKSIVSMIVSRPLITRRYDDE